MNDMSQVIIPKSDQKNADDLLAGPITIKITSVTIRPGTEQPVSVFFEGDDGKPWKPCKSMARCLVAAWGADSSKYVGRSLTLYCDPKVKWGGMDVGGIRISHMSDIDSQLTMALTVTRANKKPFTVKPLKKAAATHGGQNVDTTASNEAPADEHATAAAPITPDEAIKLELRLTDNSIKIPSVKKHFGVTLLSELNADQLAEAHAMIDSTLEQRKAAK